MTDALLPCPFCGGEKILIYKKFFKIDCPDSEMETHKKVKCDGCGIGTEWYYDTRFGTAEENARNAWNTRPQPCGDAVEEQKWHNKYHDLCNQCWGALGITEYTGKHIAEHIATIRAALTQPKADVDTLMKDVYAAYENDDDSHKKSTVAWVIDHLAAQGCIGGGWKDISTIPDNLMSGVDLWDDREEKRYINCTFDLRAQAWADEKYDFVKIPTHWMPLPSAPKKEGDDA